VFGYHEYQPPKKWTRRLRVSSSAAAGEAAAKDKTAARMAIFRKARTLTRHRVRGFPEAADGRLGFQAAD
jgi:hypothetical protein